MCSKSWLWEKTTVCILSRGNISDLLTLFSGIVRLFLITDLRSRYHWSHNRTSKCNKYFFLKHQAHAMILTSKFTTTHSLQLNTKWSGIGISVSNTYRGIIMLSVLKCLILFPFFELHLTQNVTTDIDSSFTKRPTRNLKVKGPSDETLKPGAR